MASNWTEKTVLLKANAGKYTWSQTIDDVLVSIPLGPGSFRGRDLIVEIKSQTLKIAMKATPGSPITDGPLFAAVMSNDAVWTIEDGKIELILPKAKKHEAWRYVVRGDAEADPVTFQEMEKRMMLEKFQKEHPGFDFSGAEFSGQVPKDPAAFGKFD